MPDLPTFPTALLRIEPWPDPVVDALGHHARSTYVERFWLPLLGPSATWLLRRLATGLDEAPDGYDLDLGMTATALGLGARAGRNSPFYRSIDRCCRFGVAMRIDDTALRVRMHLPPLTRLQLARFPVTLRQAHDAWVSSRRGEMDLQRERARGLALSLLERGEDPEATERALHGHALHPALAHDAVAWAIQHRTGVASGRGVPPEAA